MYLLHEFDADECVNKHANCSIQETDAGLLSIISYPAFAVDDPELIDKTRETLLEKLKVK